jgi:hypothetical protein
VLQLNISNRVEQQWVSDIKGKGACLSFSYMSVKRVVFLHLVDYLKLIDFIWFPYFSLLICLPWWFQNGIEAHCLYYFAGTKSHCRSWQDLWFCEGWFCSWCKFKFLLSSYLLSTFVLFHLYSFANLVYLV